ncbi:MAG: site-specific integrase [Chloroflexi bacterium]|nr:site-specific integrase [Chloroflexota bacterium]
MGAHKGWRVRRSPSSAGGWLAEVRDSGRYRSRTFPAKTAATAWAVAEAAAVQARASVDALEGDTARKQVDDYLANLAQRGRSAHHLADCARILGGMAASVPDLEHRSATVRLEAWLASLACGPATRNRYLTVTRGLVRWLQKRRRVRVDPTAPIERANAPRYLKPQFSLDELRTIVRAVGDRQHLRACLLLYLGLRDGETGLVQWQDVDWSGQCVLLRMRGGKIKRDKERIVPLQDELAAILWPLRQDNGPVLPTTGANGRITFDRFLRRLGIDKDGRSPHSLRHCYAGLRVATGDPAALVGFAMGHSSAATTQIYLGLAARYSQAVGDWPRGQFRLLTRWAQPIRGSTD